MKKKYFFNKEDLKELNIILKRVIKLTIAIALIKVIRIILMKNKEWSNFANEMLTMVSLEQLLKFSSVNFIVLGIIILVVWYTILGKEVIKNKIFMYVFFFCLIDATFIFLFPEIPASVFEALFLE